jgi:hypothetical protein
MDKKRKKINTFDDGISMTYSCVGIDACKGKWVAASISDVGFEVNKFDTIEDICRHYPDCDIYH